MDSSTFRLPLNEIIVDNEDVGFRLVKRISVKMGRAFLERTRVSGHGERGG